MASKKRILIKMESTADTGTFYTTSKNPTNVPDKLEMNKYDSRVRKVVAFKEKKIK